jgi:hypothetical protein
MPQNDKPLPKPPSTPFGRKRAGEQREEQEPLTADRMAAAMAEGKLEEFLTEEIPDNEHARKLANMMMGMSGMMPAEAGFIPDQPAAAAREGEARSSSRLEVPAEVMKLVQDGNVKELMDILRQEHLKRSPDTAASGSAESVSSPGAMPSQPGGMPTIDKELIDAMIRIAKENSVTVDWIILRAIKVYVQEYLKNGKL